MYPKASFIYPKALDRDFPAGKIIFVGCRETFPGRKNKFRNMYRFFLSLFGHLTILSPSKSIRAVCEKGYAQIR